VGLLKKVRAALKPGGVYSGDRHRAVVGQAILPNATYFSR